MAWGLTTSSWVFRQFMIERQAKPSTSLKWSGSVIILSTGCYVVHNIGLWIPRLICQMLNPWVHLMMIATMMIGLRGRKRGWVGNMGRRCRWVEEVIVSYLLSVTSAMKCQYECCNRWRYIMRQSISFVLLVLCPIFCVLTILYVSQSLTFLGVRIWGLVRDKGEPMEAEQSD